MTKRYNLSYAQDWEQLFKDTAAMFDKVDPKADTTNELTDYKALGEAWRRIHKEQLVPPHDLYRAERWKGD